MIDVSKEDYVQIIAYLLEGEAKEVMIEKMAEAEE